MKAHHSTKTISVVIPAFNERQRIGAALETVVGFCRQELDGRRFEIIVVNDGSTDNTVEIVKEYCGLETHVRLLENHRNRGKGHSVRVGMLAAKGDVVIFTDADLSAPISEAAVLIRAIEGGADIAIGSRWLQPQMQTRRQPAHRQLMGRIFNVLVRLVLGIRMSDTQCGLKAFTKEAVDRICTKQLIEGWGFDPELMFLAFRLGMQIEEIPVAWSHDNRSRLEPVRDSMKMFIELLRIRWNHVCRRYAQNQSPRLEGSSA